MVITDESTRSGLSACNPYQGMNRDLQIVRLLTMYNFIEAVLSSTYLLGLLCRFNTPINLNFTSTLQVAKSSQPLSEPHNNYINNNFYTSPPLTSPFPTIVNASA